MEREELLKKIDKLETILFYIDMKDHWEEEDRKSYSQKSKELREAKEELKRLYGE